MKNDEKYEKGHEDPTYQDALSKMRQPGWTVNADHYPSETTPAERRNFYLLISASILIAGHWPYVPFKEVIADAKQLLREIEEAK